MARANRKSKPAIAQLSLLSQESIEQASAIQKSAPVALISAEDADPSDCVAAQTFERGAFGAWLIQQHSHRREWIAGLARTAKADHRFPKLGSVDDVRKYLAGQGADGDAFEALDDAEMDWLAP